MADLSRIYVESCCFIDMAKQAIGVLPTARNADVWFLHKVFQAHQDKQLIAYTSVLSIAECTHAEGNTDQLVRDLFTRFLMSGQYVYLVQPTPFIGVDARDLRWRHGANLRGADALHVASAISAKCTEFLTTDGRIMDNAEKLIQLGLRVSHPRDTLLLPDRYRQGDMLDNVTTLPVQNKAKPK